MALDEEHCFRAVQSRDPRFDGWFYVGVTSTGIYCRPSCPARTPRRENVRFFTSAAAANGHGFRACRRCRPDATPGSPEWNRRGDLAGRAMRLIAEGVVEREGVSGLARRLGYSVRHLTRELTAEVGAGPLAIARSERAATARILIESTDLPFARIAFASGFASLRQFNDAIRSAYATTPTGFRGARGATTEGGGRLTLRLAARTPFDGAAVVGFLSGRTIPGVEHTADGRYRRSVRLANGVGVLTCEPQPGRVRCTLDLGDLRDLREAVERARRLFDLDADPVAIDHVLADDDALAPIASRHPGMRVPGTVDGFEMTVRALIGQQVSVAGARTIAGRLAARLGQPFDDPDGELSHAFPTPEAVAASDPDALPMPTARARAIIAVARAVSDGVIILGPAADRVETVRMLRAIKGIGPWTAGYVAMRALSDPDAFPVADLGIRYAVERLGMDGAPKAVERRAERWRPWRAYAAMHLWTSLDKREE